MANFRIIRFLVTSSCLLFVLGTAISCAPQRRVTDEHIANGKFEFLQDGKTNKQETIDRLGAPSSSYENGRIVIYYWFGEEQEVYNIVLVFNEVNLLKRHSVVRVR